MTIPHLTKELRNMRRTSLLRVFVAIAMIGTFAGCTSSNRTSETTGEYVDDAAITTKVKAAILAEPGLKTLQIGVETYKDVVQLSGFVDALRRRRAPEKSPPPCPA
jgi:osmotically-inducible protein OsmY